MKLSEAIRVGAQMRPVQEFGVLFDPVTQGSCALGAAAEAVGILDTTKRNSYVYESAALIPREWDWAENATAECPACDFPFDVQDMIIHLNNDHRWTRERIADWVDLQERSESAGSGAR